MNYKAFFNYRANAYQTQLKEVLAQLQKLSVMLMAFMYTAFPALILFIFLALGQLVSLKNDNAVEIGVLLLLIQSILLQSFSTAILDSNHRQFQYSLLAKRFYVVLADIPLLVISHIILIMSLVLALSMGLSKLLLAPHFIVFIAVQLVSAIAMLYRPHNLFFYLVCVIATLLIADMVSVLGVFSIWLALCLLFALPRIGKEATPLINNAWGFWLSLNWKHRALSEWRIYFVVIVLFCGVLTLNQRPDLEFAIALFCAIFFMLVTTSIQIKQTELANHYALWFNTLKNRDEFFRGQYLASAIHSIAAVLLLTIIYFNVFFMVSYLLASAAITFAVKRKPTHFALAWFVVSGVMCLVNYAAWLL